MHCLTMSEALTNLKNWFAEALQFTIANSYSNNNLPPSIGPQPYKDKPIKSH